MYRVGRHRLTRRQGRSDDGVPADRNWVRNLAVAKILLHHLFIYKAKARPFWYLIPE